MRAIAMYLPQFHRVPENDKWWGDGFTDWISAREAKPLFDGHYQPHIPMNEYYYDLADKSTMIWQADLMKKHGVDGQCFYHYWFKDGRRILERPAENLLEWKDIDMPFCFSWANETWARSWAGVKGSNVWSNILEKDKDNNNPILLEQNYGEEKDWIDHFYYLLPFFKDERYITIVNKPVFLIYKANQIGCLEEMLEVWRNLATENGLSGLYIIAGFSEGIRKGIIDAAFYPEPIHANKKVLQGVYDSDVRRVSYSEVWSTILSEKGAEIQTYFGGFVGYDDTPRRGNEGVVIENGTPDMFGAFLTELIAKNEAAGNDITFINAWNEWGEGMHLEPDEKYKEAYLRKIKEAKEKAPQLAGFYKNSLKYDYEDRNDKHELYLNDLDIWMSLREKGVSISTWLAEQGYKRIAIYGYGIMGKHLLRELSCDKCNVTCVIDKQKQMLHIDVPTYFPDESIPNSDVVIVASYYFYDSAKRALPQDSNVVSLGSLLHKLKEEYMCE